MNYKKHYDKLIRRAKNRIIDGYVEKHHVIPKCLGGIDERSNIVILTAEEHFVAHLLLMKMHPNNYKLFYAARMMTVSKFGQKRIHNKRYSWLKQKRVKENAPRKVRAKETKPRKKRTLTIEHRRKIALALTGRPVSDQQRLKCSLSNIRTKRR